MRDIGGKADEGGAKDDERAELGSRQFANEANLPEGDGIRSSPTGGN